jgi:very-short-patch-repair endonuclease
MTYMADRRLDEEIARLAARQHGVVSREQLLRIGLGTGAVQARRQAGRLHLVHRGVYLVGHTAEAPHAPEMAGVLACGDGAVVSHRSAASLWSFAHRFAVTRVELTVPGRRALRRPGLHVHETDELAPNDVSCVDGIPATSPTRTLLDIARFLRVHHLEHVLADAERRGLVLRGELIRELVRHRGRRGIATLRLALGNEPAFTRSTAERKLIKLIREASLPSPLTNARVGLHEVDILWPHEHLIVEIDGYQWHSDRAAFERDRLRDAELQALGYRVIRVTWRMIQREPRAVIARIAATLRRAVNPRSHR